MRFLNPGEGLQVYARVEKCVGTKGTMLPAKVAIDFPVTRKIFEALATSGSDVVAFGFELTMEQVANLIEQLTSAREFIGKERKEDFKRQGISE
jgi:hypothetical protein